MFKYGDMMKKADDLLSKRYEFGRKVTFKTTSADGVTFEGEGAFPCKGAAVSSLSAKFKNGNLSVDKLKVSSEGVLNGKMALAGVADDLTVKFEAQEAPEAHKKGTECKLGVGYKKDNFLVNAMYDVMPASGGSFLTGGSLHTDATASFGDFFGGVTADYRVGGKCTNYGVGLGYNGSGFRVAAQTKPRGDNGFGTIKLGAHHAVNDSVSWAGVFNYDVLNAAERAAKAEGKFCATVGASYKLKDDASIEAKFGSCATLSANYQTALNKCATLTVSGKINVKDTTKAGYGLSLEFSG